MFDNYPNPFNPETAIDYQIFKASQVTIKIFNIGGQEIKTLADEFKPEGYCTVYWAGRNNFGNCVVSGIHLYQIKAGDFVCTKKMALMK